MKMLPEDSLLRVALRWLAAVGFIFAGAYHFVQPGPYRRIVPPGFGPPGVMVAISGICEIAGGLGLLIRPLRRLAGFGLIALLIAVFPANVYMATHPERVPELRLPAWMLWARLPLQGLLIAWVWYVLDRQRSRRLAVKS